MDEKLNPKFLPSFFKIFEEEKVDFNYVENNYIVFLNIYNLVGRNIALCKARFEPQKNLTTKLFDPTKKQLHR